MTKPNGYEVRISFEVIGKAYTSTEFRSRIDDPFSSDYFLAIVLDFIKQNNGKYRLASISDMVYLDYYNPDDFFHKFVDNRSKAKELLDDVGIILTQAYGSDIIEQEEKLRSLLEQAQAFDIVALQPRLEELQYEVAARLSMEKAGL